MMEDKYKLLKTRCRPRWRREQDGGLSKIDLNGNKMADNKNECKQNSRFKPKLLKTRLRM